MERAKLEDPGEAGNIIKMEGVDEISSYNGPVAGANEHSREPSVIKRKKRSFCCPSEEFWVCAVE